MSSPNLNMLVANNKVMWVVKLCSDEIFIRGTG